ncbi:EamA family transporter RarD [Brevundimonas sp.]|uniref:EamA family transporter RarD n=1 Tax=Brevundimonas sp. TaxID=1871086 RepID=UPI002D4FFF33|nr:EamA family transporter RarD [Brevundimonas sp.]HYC97054.1 EamA family transporter RarD [Brevundimonas sp.]
MTTVTGSDQGRAALLSAFGCYVLWGVMPLLFMGQAAIGFDALEILAHRALWAVVFAGLLVWLAKQGGQVRAVFTSPKTLAWLGASTVLIAVNWGVYVWATTHGATLEASLGYYINPLLNMIVGLWLFREKIDRWGWVAIGLAAVGVLFQALALGRPPWISIVLALSFASYGVIRKRVPIDAQAGLLVECLLLVPFGLAWVLWLQHTGAGVAFDSPGNALWALANGPATVLPLALFAWSARRLPLSTIGFIQFLAPTLQFAVGVWAGEALTPLRILSFAFIWGGAAVFAAAAFFRVRAARQALKDAAEPA